MAPKLRCPSFISLALGLSVTAQVLAVDSSGCSSGSDLSPLLISGNNYTYSVHVDASAALGTEIDNFGDVYVGTNAIWYNYTAPVDGLFLYRETSDSTPFMFIGTSCDRAKWFEQRTVSGLGASARDGSSANDYASAWYIYDNQYGVKLTAGQTIKVGVAAFPDFGSSYNTSAGYDLDFMFLPPPPAPTNDTCDAVSAAAPVTLPLAGEVFIAGAHDDLPGRSCQAPSADAVSPRGIWYKYTAAQAHTLITFNTEDFDFFTGSRKSSMGIFSGSCTNLSPVACLNDAEVADLPAAGTYYFLVASFDGLTLDVHDSAYRFSINVEAPICVADHNRSGTVTVQDIFSFLSAWFAGNTSADANSSSTVTVQDIFFFLSRWFAGC